MSYTVATRARSVAAHKRIAPRRIVAERVPPLENGQRLDADEFMRRYAAMPELKKAELIEGKVYIMASPLRVDEHADPDFLAHVWLGIYMLSTPGVKGSSNPTLKLGARNIPQPDAVLRLLPDRGGKTRVDEKGYLAGPAELVVEIAASSASVDLHEKLLAYQKAGIAEYIAWRTEDAVLNWFQLKDGKYVELRADDDGIHRSCVFPGLWLDAAALLRGDKKRVFAILKRGLKSPEHAKFVKRIGQYDRR